MPGGVPYNPTILFSNVKLCQIVHPVFGGLKQLTFTCADFQFNLTTCKYY